MNSTRVTLWQVIARIIAYLKLRRNAGLFICAKMEREVRFIK